MPKTYDIVGKRKIYYIISSSIIALAIIMSLVFGVKVAIEFKGGTMLSYSYTGDIEINDVSSVASGIVNQEVTVKTGETIADKSTFIELSFASSEGISSDVQAELTDTLQNNFKDNNLDLLSSKDVKPSNGITFFQKCLVAVAFACIILIVYIALRFKRISGLSAGAMALVALFHDMLIVYATFVIFRIAIDANFMAVLLTILGYSINDTIVIYDRIRENKKLLGKNISTAELVNTSINQSLTRSINTSLSTVLVLTVVSIVAVLFDVTSIISFSFPLIIGMISGTYSSICIAGPLWVDWQNHKAKKGLNYAKRK